MQFIVLQTVRRTGWVNHNVSEPESVADHMYRMAMMTFLLSSQSSVIDTQRYGNQLFYAFVYMDITYFHQHRVVY